MITIKINTIFTSKFIITIKTWSEEELKFFEHWLNSPWCNTNKNLIRLFDRLKRHYPHFDKPKLTKEKLFQQILPNGKFSTRRMNNLLSEAYLAAERFMVFQNLSEDQNLQNDLLTKELQSRHLEDWFFKDANKEIERLEEKPIKNWEDHLALLQLHRRIYHHPNQNPRMQPGGTTIVKMGEQIDLVYLLEKAVIINEKIFRNRILKNENHDVAKEMKKWYVLSEGFDHPSIEFYSMRFNYTEENMLEQYLKLRDIFLERFEELNEKEQKVHLLSLLNDTTLLGRAGRLDTTQILPLYKLGLKTDILLNNDLLDHKTYAQILSASNKKKSFDFSIEFINTYTKKLDKTLQSDAFHWANAHTVYAEKKLTNCLDILLSHGFKSSYFQIIGKILTTQVYFDLYLKDDSYQSYLFNYFDSFEKWVLREKFRSGFIKKSYLRFIQVSRALIKSHSDVNFKPEAVKDLLINEVNIQAPNWLKQKVEEIITLRKRGRPKLDDLP